MQDTQTSNFVDQIQQDMRLALKNGDRLECDALRTLFARISNAEAITAPEVAELSLGVASSEAARKPLSLIEVRDIIMDEADEIQAALNRIDATTDYTKELQEKLTVVQRYIKP